MDSSVSACPFAGARVTLTRFATVITKWSSWGVASVGSWRARIDGGAKPAPSKIRPALFTVARSERWSVARQVVAAEEREGRPRVGGCEGSGFGRATRDGSCRLHLDGALYKRLKSTSGYCKCKGRSPKGDDNCQLLRRPDRTGENKQSRTIDTELVSNHLLII